MLPTINRIKSQMQRNFTESFTNVNDTHVGYEPLSIFKLGERRRKRTTITKIQSENSEFIEDSNAIEAHMLQYFCDLYTATETTSSPNSIFQCERIIQPFDKTNERCTREISTSEIYETIKTSKNNRVDGFTKEFYHRTFVIIHREINMIINEALTTGFPVQFVDGIIVLLKKSNSNDTVHAYRPISVLNFDYKILARILKTRIDKIIQNNAVLSEAQKCSNGERNIFQATLALKDRLAQMIATKRKAKLVSFDLDHAFDRVEHNFVYNTMRSLGFNS